LIGVRRRLRYAENLETKLPKLFISISKTIQSVIQLFKNIIFKNYYYVFILAEFDVVASTEVVTKLGVFSYEKTSLIV